jgi:hypothetical protein
MSPDEAMTPKQWKKGKQAQAGRDAERKHRRYPAQAASSIPEGRLDSKRPLANHQGSAEGWQDRNHS